MIASRHLLLLLLALPVLHADSLSPSLSFQGYTGVINTPNAQVMREGDLTLQYNNQYDNHLRGYDPSISRPGEDNYIVGMGFFSWFELQGRLVNVPEQIRDLSFNVKVQLPFHFDYFPDIAFGVQDLGGDVSFYDNQYVVMDKQIWIARASIGYGKSEVQQIEYQRMDGLFGGIEVRTFSWLYLLGDNDSRQKSIGGRFEMPPSWTERIKLDALLVTNLDDDEKISFSINLTIPLEEKVTNQRPVFKTLNTSKNPGEPYGMKSTPKNVYNKYMSTVKQQGVGTLDKEQIARAMRALDLENIVVVSEDDRLIISYENNTFLFNELDAIGVVLGLAVQSSSAFKQFTIEPKKSKVPVMSLHGDLNAARAYYRKRDALSQTVFAKTLEIHRPQDNDLMQADGTVMHNSFLRPRLEISPVVKTFVGTEYGVFDYMLWLRGNLYFNLYKGIDVSLVGDVAIAHTDAFDPESGVWRFYYNDSHMQSIMLHNSDNIFGAINTLSVGSLEENYVGAMDQLIYVYGNHTFKLKGGYFEQFKGGNPELAYWFGEAKYRTLYLAKYTYMIEGLDLLGEVRGGQYWHQDLGFDVALKRYFGDVAFSLFYQQSNGTNKLYSEEVDRYAGASVEIPLTLPKTPVYRYGQVKGSSAFSYGLRTTVLRDTGANRIITTGTIDPKTAFESETYFLNRNRLQIGYIRSHLFRLINAYDHYVSDASNDILPQLEPVQEE